MRLAPHNRLYLDSIPSLGRVLLTSVAMAALTWLALGFSGMVLLWPEVRLLLKSQDIQFARSLPVAAANTYAYALGWCVAQIAFIRWLRRGDEAISLSSPWGTAIKKRRLLVSSSAFLFVGLTTAMGFLFVSKHTLFASPLEVLLIPLLSSTHLDFLVIAVPTGGFLLCYGLVLMFGTIMEPLAWLLVPLVILLTLPAFNLNGV